jgi:hypothetical protein
LKLAKGALEINVNRKFGPIEHRQVDGRAAFEGDKSLKSKELRLGKAVFYKLGYFLKKIAA